MFATTVFFRRLWRTLSSGICQSVKAKRNLWRKTWTRQRNDRARGVRTAIWGQTRTLCSSKVNFLIELRFGWHGIKQHLKSEPWYSEFIQTWHVIFWSDIAIHRWHDRLSKKPQKERKLFVSWKAWSGVCFFKCALSSAQSSPSPVHQSCSFHLQMKANIACVQPFWCMRGNTRSLIWEMNRKSLQSWDAWTVSLFDLESRALSSAETRNWSDSFTGSGGRIDSILCAGVAKSTSRQVVGFKNLRCPRCPCTSLLQLKDGSTFAGHCRAHSPESGPGQGPNRVWTVPNPFLVHC
jgi:hypothetical protein